MARAAITADCLQAEGYLATSRSILFSESALSIRNGTSSFAVVVVDVGGLGHELRGKGRLGQRSSWLAPADAAELPRIRVLPHVGVDRGADCDVTQLGRAGVDELVRDLGPARRAGDEVPLAHREFLGAEAQHALAVENEEH